MKEKIFCILRQWYTADTSIGRLILPDNTEFCFTLEDSARAWGVKVPKHTAIPATGPQLYQVAVTYSSRFQKELPVIYTEIDKDGNYLLKNGGIQFSAIRFHGGNDKDDSEGCPLVAFEWDKHNKIYNPDPKNRADEALTKIIKEYLAQGFSVRLSVRNLPNKF